MRFVCFVLKKAVLKYMSLVNRVCDQIEWISIIVLVRHVDSASIGISSNGIIGNVTFRNQIKFKAVDWSHSQQYIEFLHTGHLSLQLQRFSKLLQ